VPWSTRRSLDAVAIQGLGVRQPPPAVASGQARVDRPEPDDLVCVAGGNGVEIVMCPLCSTTVMLDGELADPGDGGFAGVAVQWLIAQGWRQHADGTWTCGEHPDLAR